MTKNFFRQTYFIYLTELISRGFGFFTAILIARELSQTALGQISYASSLVFLFAVFTDLGYAPVAVKKFAQSGKSDAQALNPAFTLKFFSSLASLLGISLLLLHTPPKDSSTAMLILLFAVNLVAGALSFPYQFALRGLRLFQYENILKLCSAAVGFGLLLIFLKVNPDVTLIGGVIPLIISAIMFAGFYSLNGRLKVVDVGFVWEFKKLAGFFKECLPFSLTVIITLFHNKLDIVMLKGFTDFQTVGVYVLAYKIIETLNIIPNVIFSVTFPALAAQFADRDKKLERTIFLLTKHLLFIAVPLMFALFLFGDKALELFMGRAFSQAGVVLGLLALIIIPTFLYAVTSGVILAGPRPEVNTAIQFCSSLSYFLLLAFLIPAKGVLGLVYALIAVEWGGLFAKMVYVNYRICRVAYAPLIAKTLAVTVIAAVPLWFFRNWTSLGVFLGLYGVALVMSGLVEKEEFRDFYRLAGAFGE